MIEAVAALVLVGAGLLSSLSFARWVEHSQEQASSKTYRLRFPRDVLEAEVITFVAALGGLRPPWYVAWLHHPVVILEVTAEHGEIAHFLTVSAQHSGLVLSRLQAAMPNVRVEEHDEFKLPEVQSGAELRISTRSRPAKTERIGDTSTAILSSFQPLEPGERIVWQWIVSPSQVPKPVRLRERSGPAATDLPLPADYDRLPHAEALKARRAKQLETPFVCIGRAGVRATTAKRRAELLTRSVSALQLLTAPGVQVRPRTATTQASVARRVNRRAVTPTSSSVLNAIEIGGVVAWPIGISQLPGLELGGCPDLPPAIDIPRTGLVIGDSTYPGDKRPIALSDLDRNTHVSITGPTGSGKSVLLAALVEQDMRSGRGCVVIDVKGSLVDDCLRRVPTNRLKDVIVLDPSDEAKPVGINLLSTAYASKELVADQVVQVFKALFEDGWGPRSDDLLRACCLTLMRDPAMTMVEIVPLLMNEAFRRRFIGLVKDDTIGLAPFWTLFGALKPNERIQTISPLLNKCRQILLRPAVRNCVGQSKATLDLGAALDSGKLLFIPLPEGVLGDEAASLLGSLLVSRIYSATQSRIAQAEAERRPVTLYLDEAHRLTGSAIGLENLLAQARATKLSVVLATQFLHQYPPDIRLAVLSNARSKILFQPTAKDAQLYAAELKPFVTADQLQGLRRFEVVAELVAKQRVTEPVTAITRPPTAETGNGDRARTHSRTHYGRKREDIEAELKARHATVTTAAPIGRQRKRGTS